MEHAVKSSSIVHVWALQFYNEVFQTGNKNLFADGMAFAGGGQREIVCFTQNCNSCHTAIILHLQSLHLIQFENNILKLFLVKKAMRKKKRSICIRPDLRLLSLLLMYNYSKYCI